MLHNGELCFHPSKTQRNQHNVSKFLLLFFVPDRTRLICILWLQGIQQRFHLTSELPGRLEYLEIYSVCFGRFLIQTKIEKKDFAGKSEQKIFF